MNACMHDYAKEHRKHGEVKSNMMESRLNMPFGNDYGFICICNKGSTKFPKSNPSEFYWMTGQHPVQQRS